MRTPRPRAARRFLGSFVLSVALAVAVTIIRNRAIARDRARFDARHG